jgi:hypothetical protein
LIDIDSSNESGFSLPFKASSATAMDWLLVLVLLIRLVVADSIYYFTVYVCD